MKPARAAVRAALVAACLLGARAAEASWTSETVASVHAAYSSVVLDSSGNPHISYQNLTSNSALSIADWTGSSWSLTTVGNPPMQANNQAFGTALARDSANNLYSTSMQSSPKNVWLIKRVNATWTAATGLPNVGAGTGQTCVFVSSPNVYLAYFDSGLKFLSSNNGGSSVGALTTVDAGSGSGQYCSIASTGTSAVHISYYDSTAGDLKYAFYNGSAWTTASVDTTGTVGSFTSIGLDASSRPHISYIDATNNKLKHAVRNGAVWTTEAVDASSGSYTSLAVSSMVLHIAYFDPPRGALKWATFDGVSWSTETADSTGGQYASLALNAAGNPVVASVYGTTQLRYSVRAAPGACAAVTSAGSGNWSAAGTWSGSAVPSSCSPVTIAAGHTVTVDGTAAVASTVTVNGTLSFSRSASSKLALTGGGVSLAAGGVLDLGTEASPIPAARTATLQLATGPAGGFYGLTVADGAVFTARGAARSPFGYALSSLSSGAQSLTLSASSATGWAVGDLIAVGPTSGTGSSTVEERVITAVSGTDPLTVSWSGGLASARTRTADTPIVVVNLTRNASVNCAGSTVTASAGGSGGSNGFVRSLTSSATSFYAAYAEFVSLGAEAPGKRGVTLDGGAAQGTVSSSTFRGGLYGLVVSSATGVTLTGNVFSRNLAAGLLLDMGGLSSVYDGVAQANGGAGFALAGSSGNALSGLRAAGNDGDGLALAAGAHDVSVSSLASHSNGGHGVSVAGAASSNLGLQASRLYANAGNGLDISDAPGASLAENALFSNGGAGIKLCGGSSSGHFVLGGSLGYDGAGVSKANANGEVRACGGGGVKVQLNAAAVNPAAGGIVATTFCAGDQASSYNQDGVSGRQFVFGDYQVAASTLSLRHTQRTRAPAYTGPVSVKGDSTLTAITVNLAAVNELFKIVNAGGNSWTVTGQKSGGVGTITCAPSSNCAFTSTPVNFTLATAASVRTGDRIHLVTHQPSNDANANKGLRAGGACPSFNGGRARITIPPGSGFVLEGAPGDFATIASLDGVSSFTFVSSGAFSMASSSASRLDKDGLQLSGAGPLTLSSSAFDNNAAGNEPKCSYLTFNSLAVNAFLPALYFGNGNVCPNPNSILVTGSTASLSITLSNPTGPLAGDDYISGGGGGVASSGGGPYIPGAGSPALLSVSSASAAAQWTRNSNPDGTDFSLQASTASDFTGTVLSSVTRGLSGTVWGLSPGATYHLRVNASTRSASSDYRALGSTVTSLAAPGPLAYSALSTAALTANWSSGGNPAGTVYTVLLSSGAGPSGNGFSGNQSSATANLFAVFGGLSPNASYYAEVRIGSGVWVSLGVAATLAAAPASDAPTAVSDSQLTENWGANGNPAGTLYVVTLSTGASPASNGFSGNQSSSTLATSAAFSGLLPNASYYAEVRALNRAGTATAYTALLSTVTRAALPVAGPFGSLGAAQLAATWTSGGNPSGTLYDVRLSSGASPSTNGFSGNQSSTTLSVSTLFTGLSPNTSYFAEVRAFNRAGTPTAFVALGSTPTLAAPPAASAAGDAAPDRLTLNWGANGNPSGTLYEAELSTGPVFSAPASSSTPGLSALFTGLTGNATYYGRVRARNRAGVPTADTSLGSALTPPAAPGAAPYVPASYQVLAVWAANGNGPGTLYRAILSTGASPSSNGFAGNVSSATFNLSALFTGLGPNTSYWAEVRAEGSTGTLTAYTDLGPTMTSPVPPQPPGPGQGILTVGTGTITASWGASPGNSHYTLAASTSSGPDGQPGALASTSTVTLAQGGLGGLTPNTTYQCFASACNAIACSTYTSVGSTITLAAAPLFTGYTASSASLTLNWSAQGNPPGTAYTALLSSGDAPSGNGFPGNRSSATVALSASFWGLSPNTTYYAQVRATNSNGLHSAWDSLPTGVTLAVPPGALPYTAVGTSGLTANWTPAGNAAGTRYAAALSTGASPSLNGFSGNQSSVTLAEAAVFAGLSVNTTYWVVVRALNHADEPSADTALGPKATLAAVPSAQAPSGVLSDRLTLNWGANGNPEGTLYAALLSTGDAPSSNGFSGNRSSVTLSLSAQFTGLSPFTTYYALVRAQNREGVATAYTALAATMTLAGAPADPSGTTLSTGSLSGTWQPGGNPPGTLYRLDASTAPDLSGALVSTQTASTNAPLGGLAPNTTYWLRVEVLRGDGTPTGVFGPIVPVVTWALPPVGALATPVETTVAGLTWGSGGNPDGTAYLLQVSAAAGFPTLAGSSATVLTTATVSGLTPDTTYHLRVRAISHGGVATAFAASVATVTLAEAPASLAAVFRGTGSLVFAWSGSGNPANTAYTLELSTASDFSGTLRSASAATTSAGLGGLPSNTVYHARVRAVNRAGTPSAYAASVSTPTAGLAPGAPTLSAYALSSSTIRWSWTPGPGGAPTAWTLFASSGVAVSPALGGGADYFLEHGLSANVLYYRYLRASNDSGEAFSSTDAVSIPVSYDLQAGSSTAAALNDPLTGAPTLEIPAGATADVMRWLVSVAPDRQPLVDVTPELISAANARLPASVGGSTSSVREYLVTLNDVRYTGTFLQPVTVIVPYPDADNDGFVDGTSPPVDVDTLKLYTLNENTGVWELMPVSTVDRANKTVRGQVMHLSIYTAFGTGASLAAAPAGDVSAVRAFPNPWRPGSGGDYDAPVVVFDGLPAQAIVSIYTLSGELVRSIEKNDATGQALWDGSARSGTRVASGMYYWLVTTPSGAKKKGRLGVVR